MKKTKLPPRTVVLATLQKSEAPISAKTIAAETGLSEECVANVLNESRTLSEVECDTYIDRKKKPEIRYWLTEAGKTAAGAADLETIPEAPKKKRAITPEIMAILKALPAGKEILPEDVMAILNKAENTEPLTREVVRRRLHELATEKRIHATRHKVEDGKKKQGGFPYFTTYGLIKSAGTEEEAIETDPMNDVIAALKRSGADLDNMTPAECIDTMSAALKVFRSVVDTPRPGNLNGDASPSVRLYMGEPS